MNLVVSPLNRPFQNGNAHGGLNGRVVQRMGNGIAVAEGGICHLFPVKGGFLEGFIHPAALVHPVAHVADDVLVGIALQIVVVILIQNQAFDKVVKFRFVMPLIQLRDRLENLILITGIHKHADYNGGNIQLVGQRYGGDNQIRVKALNHRRLVVVQYGVYDKPLPEALQNLVAACPRHGVAVWLNQNHMIVIFDIQPVVGRTQVNGQEADLILRNGGLGVFLDNMPDKHAHLKHQRIGLFDFRQTDVGDHNLKLYPFQQILQVQNKTVLKYGVRRKINVVPLPDHADDFQRQLLRLYQIILLLKQCASLPSNEQICK